jgi:hypothetical protein
MHVNLKMGRAICIHLASLHPNTGRTQANFQRRLGLRDLPVGPPRSSAVPRQSPGPIGMRRSTMRGARQLLSAESGYRHSDCRSAPLERKDKKQSLLTSGATRSACVLARTLLESLTLVQKCLQNSTSLAVGSVQSAAGAAPEAAGFAASVPGPDSARS